MCIVLLPRLRPVLVLGDIHLVRTSAEGRDQVLRPEAMVGLLVLV